MVRSIAFVAVFYINTAVFLLFGSPLLFAPRSWAMAGLRAHARTSLWWMRRIVGTGMEVRGLENLPEGPALIAAKHQSAWDTFALIPLLRDPAMIMKAELGSIPFYGWFSRKFEHILVRRDKAAAALRQMIAQARDRASQNRDIVIFPEGTRRPAGAPPDYKSGVLALYDGLERPCVPVALNSGMYWPRGTLLKRSGTVVVEILEPIPPGLPRAEFRRLLIERIETASEALRQEALGDIGGATKATDCSTPHGNKNKT
ncbi:MAG: acyl-phosphate glycerol 3-phosphate acyltransferase [Alphaproteobacteria bacterium BRH_c36]|nr:MAG: acyl-phosphate glycerol 3-phosphate acyltransferase [Alphaproteobacteria bacterium BRH_c36]